MKTIGIIGGNGQVGSEVSLFLSLRSDVRVIPISRSFYGTTFLRHCGLTCRHGSLTSPDEARRLLEGCDVVADFSVPHGTPPEIRKTMAANITSAVAYSRDATQYIYVGSHSIYRHTVRQAHYRLYPRAKLYAEHFAQGVASEAGKELYVLRLGMVHGVLQGASRGYLENLRDEEAVLPNIPSLVVFAFSVAEALVNIADHKEEPGTYTLVPVPPWSWPEVHEYYCRRAGIEPRMRLESVRSEKVSQTLWNGFKESAAPVRRGLFSERELLDDLLSTNAPALAARLRARYYVERAQAELAMRDGLAWRPVEQDFDAPGTRLRTLSDSRTTMHAPTQAVEELISSAFQRRLDSQPVSAP
jgi:nucleoside-diphosphate-sugar epimerase